MTERPILFSGPMIRAILDGRKTQARRIMKPQPVWIGEPCVPFKTKDADPSGIIRCPYGRPGDRLWVREKWQWKRQQYCICPQPSEASPCDDWMEGTGCKSNRSGVIYAADCEAGHVGRWRPSIHMPRWASRITLEITEVRVQRVQEISREDCRAEGLDEEQLDGGSHCIDGMKSWHVWWMDLWNRINGPGSWEKNPWVWALTFNSVSPAT